MFVDFFIRRPVLSAVLALLIALAGAICIPLLPVAEFPSLQSPEVTVDATYVGASAETLETAVTLPLELAVNGAIDLKYLSSETWTGGTEIVATFDVDRDPNLAVLDVQNRVNRMLDRLPPPVRELGVQVSRHSGAVLLGMPILAEKGKYSTQFISNYADVHIVNALKRIPGVANAYVDGQRTYAIRIWLDPLQLAAHQLTAQDVVDAIREQNEPIAAGVIGAAPAQEGQLYEITVHALGRLSSPEEFGALVLKAGRNGALVQLRDVARVELGAEDYGSLSRYHGEENVAVGATVLAGANELSVRNAVLARMEELKRSFPPGLTYTVPFDTTTAVSDSLRELLRTLLIAIALVVLVIFAFLQSFRATLISAIVIPVSLLGTFLFVKLFGFSINTLTLFGLTLATGLVVDDAVVVLENVERHLEEEGGRADRAASRGMREVTGAVLATSIVLIAVFVPITFFPGFTGRLYRQFALTIAFSVAISTFLAFTLTPSLAALLLRRDAGPRGFAHRGLQVLSRGYARSLRGIERHWPWALLAFALALAGTAWLLRTLPRTIAPPEDRNFFVCNLQAPEGASLEVTAHLMQKVEKVIESQPEVEGFFSYLGGGTSNFGSGYVGLKPIEQRQGVEHNVGAVIRRVRKALSGITGAVISVYQPAPIEGLGDTGGFTLQLLDEGGGSLSTLAQATQDLVHAGMGDHLLEGVSSNFAANDPQLQVEIERARAMALHVPLQQIADALRIDLGSAYVNDFEMDNRAYRVIVQADRAFRSRPNDLNQLYVRTDQGSMIPLESLVRLRETAAPQDIRHYDLYRTAAIGGDAAPGVSSGTAIAEMEKLAQRVLPAGIGFEWTGIALEERASQRAVLAIFGLTLLFVYLVLAGLYESFLLPLILLLTVPVALLGALGAQALRGFTNDLYCQIGLVMLVGLASKNAILIVEFAEQLRGRGRSLVEAATEASRERLRPILMTSFAFILGMLPLVLAGAGPGANARRSLGTAVVGGMLVSTLLNLYITPIFYILIQGLRERWRGTPAVEPHV